MKLSLEEGRDGARVDFEPKNPAFQAEYSLYSLNYNDIDDKYPIRSNIVRVR